MPFYVLFTAYGAKFQAGPYEGYPQALTYSEDIKRHQCVERVAISTWPSTDSKCESVGRR